MQRVKVWREAFSRVAMDTFESFFRSFPCAFQSMEMRSRYCKKILAQDTLFYEDPENNRALQVRHLLLEYWSRNDCV